MNMLLSWENKVGKIREKYQNSLYHECFSGTIKKYYISKISTSSLCTVFHSPVFLDLHNVVHTGVLWEQIA